MPTEGRKVSPARIAAFKVLRRVERDKAFSSILLPQVEAELSPKDKKLCHKICLGVLRNKIFLDEIIKTFARDKKIDLEIRIILRMGLYQLIFLDKVPSHAAVSESVNLAEICGKPEAKGFVNAILRKYRPGKLALPKDPVDRLSITESHPRFLIERWIRQFGFDETVELVKANNEEAELDFRFTAKTSPAVKELLSGKKVVVSREELLELASRGEIYFQDKASQLIASLVEIHDGENFLDLCCAPGGKFTLIHLLAKPKGLFVGADVFLQRLRMVKENCRKLGIQNYQLLACNAEMELPFENESFDVVLVDAPCSGTGTIRRNPEIRYFLKETDFAVLSEKQSRILENASRVLKRGGRLVYSTCSLEREENEEVINAFLQKHKNFSLLKPDLTQNLTKEGFMRTFPHKDKADGFFAAILKKV
ncbi:MAG: 16S rRNA (cytosine(967)-C(5))-methyltransferase RsmB [Acidobacteria bacterium]|jgi:16S rRNA (cytosine967-C5)-methyltransferase|nr:MAG: 16S rRNA (cytosine(967)-C(5))-methyltransferase RsmB [Acidobacteriota bacterium]GIU81777.1 MAG: ribosomal RNA small subunit methyltransferase B [Pyrinomonadaceae bacterium]